MTKEKEENKEESEIDMLERIERATDRLEKENRAMQELLDRQDKSKFEETLSGEAEAGDKEKVEISDKEYAQRVMNGEIPK